jgi:hypothetical protein
VTPSGRATVRLSNVAACGPSLLRPDYTAIMLLEEA